MPPSLAIGYTYVTNDPLLAWLSRLTGHPVSSFREVLRPLLPAATILQEGGSMHLKTHLTVLSHLIPLLQLDQCGGALSSMPGLRGHRAPPFLADGLAPGPSIAQTPNLLPLKRLVQGQLVRSPVLGHLGTWSPHFPCNWSFLLSLSFSPSLCVSVHLCLLAPSPG